MLATWQILDAATAARKRLLRAGYFPIPTNGKKPPIAGWTGIVATDATIESWFSLFPEALNTGILTRTTPAVDVDVYDPDVAAELYTTNGDVTGDAYNNWGTQAYTVELSGGTGQPARPKESTSTSRRRL